jgi:methyl-accepting chemotaxis protein
MFISAFVFMLPVFILAFLTFRSQGVNIDFAVQENHGNEHQRPLMAILNSLGLHRVYAQRVLNGETAARSELDSLSSKIDNAFTDLARSEEKYGAELQFTADGLGKRHREGATASNAAQKWQKLKSDLASSKAAASNVQHADLIALVRTMITHMGDTSNLILDPDLDSYYLMDVTLVALPQTIDRLQDIITNVEPMLTQANLSVSDRVSVAVYAAMLKEADYARSVGSSETALNEDANFYGRSDSLQSKLPPLLTNYKAANDKLLALLNQIADPAQKLPEKDAFTQAGQATIDASYNYWLTSITELEGLLNTRTGSLSSDRTQQMAFALAILGVACVLSFFIARSLIKSVSGISATLSESSRKVQGNADQMSNASTRLSASASEGAGSLEETVASIEELSSIVNNNAQHVADASEYSRRTKTLAEDGAGEVKTLVKAMNEIRESSRKIEEIINVIDDIAFQTNLLALNAAVEAARAGEQGRGFAVVAEAVRNLAQRSSTAAKEITSLIQESTSRVDRGAQIASKSGTALDSIVKGVTEIAAINEQIAGASREQAIGLNQISKAMNQLDQATQGNASMAEETATSAEQLSRESIHMQNEVESLITLIQGGGAAGGGYLSHAADHHNHAAASSSHSNAGHHHGHSGGGHGGHGHNSHHSAAAPASHAAAAPRPVATNNVVKYGAKSSESAAAAIPFGDDDDGGSHIGDASGF